MLGVVKRGLAGKREIEVSHWQLVAKPNNIRDIPWMGLHPELKISYPNDILFSRGLMSGLGGIFQLIFLVKVSKQVLDRIWLRTTRSKYLR